MAGNKRDSRRKKIVTALSLLKEIHAETPESTIIDQSRKGLYETTIYSLKAELKSSKGENNVSL